VLRGGTGANFSNAIKYLQLNVKIINNVLIILHGFALWWLFEHGLAVLQ